jgi:hypothetical protein
LEKAKKAAKQGKEILPGLFKYGEDPNIPGYAQHHLWPQAMGGPLQGWTVYAKQPHQKDTLIHGRLKTFLIDKLGMPWMKLQEWARANPEEILPYLRKFYKTEGIAFPY